MSTYPGWEWPGGSGVVETPAGWRNCGIYNPEGGALNILIDDTSDDLYPVEAGLGTVDHGATHFTAYADLADGFDGIPAGESDPFYYGRWVGFQWTYPNVPPSHNDGVSDYYPGFTAHTGYSDVPNTELLWVITQPGEWYDGSTAWSSSLTLGAASQVGVSTSYAGQLTRGGVAYQSDGMPFFFADMPHAPGAVVTLYVRGSSGETSGTVAVALQVFDESQMSGPHPVTPTYNYTFPSRHYFEGEPSANAADILTAQGWAHDDWLARTPWAPLQSALSTPGTHGPRKGHNIAGDPNPYYVRSHLQGHTWDLSDLPTDRNTAFMTSDPSWGGFTFWNAEDRNTISELKIQPRFYHSSSMLNGVSAGQGTRLWIVQQGEPYPPATTPRPSGSWSAQATYVGKVTTPTDISSGSNIWKYGSTATIPTDYIYQENGEDRVAAVSNDEILWTLPDGDLSPNNIEYESNYRPDPLLYAVVQRPDYYTQSFTHGTTYYYGSLGAGDLGDAGDGQWHTADNYEPPPDGVWGDWGVEDGWAHVSWMRLKDRPGSGRTGRLKVRVADTPSEEPGDSGPTSTPETGNSPVLEPYDPPDDPTPVGQVAAVTYNMPGWVPNKTSEIRELTTRASIIGLQECLHFRQELAAWSSDWYWYQPDLGGGDPGGYVTTPIGVNRDVWGVLDEGTWQLSTWTWVQPAAAGVERKAPRHVVWLRVRPQAGGDDLVVASTHFVPSKHLGGATRELWRLQRDRTVAWLNSLPTTRRVILLGDFNGQAHEAIAAPLRQVAAYQDGVTHHGRRIDIAWSRNLSRSGARALSGFGSDHKPLRATWQW